MTEPVNTACPKFKRTHTGCMKYIRYLVLAGLLSLPSAAWAEPAFPMKGEPRYDAPRVAWGGDGPAAFSQDRIRVAFYNLEHFTDGIGDGPDRTSEKVTAQAAGAAGLLDEIDADIVLIAEIENTKSLSELNRHLKRPYAFGWTSDFGDGQKSGDKLNHALLARAAPVDVVEIDYSTLQGAGRPPRGSLRARFDLGDGHQLVVYSAHLKSNFGYRPRNMYQRRHGLQWLANDARALQKGSSDRFELLVLGDMNVDPDSPEFAGDWSLSPFRGWRDLWRGRPLPERATVPTRFGDPALEFPPACFDRIYAGGDATNAPWTVSAPGVLQRGVNTRTIKALPGEDGHISDHHPVWVDVLR